MRQTRNAGGSCPPRSGHGRRRPVAKHGPSRALSDARPVPERGHPDRPSEIYHLRPLNSRDLQLRALGHRLVQVTNQIERLFWQFVKLTGQNLVKAADRIL